MTKQLICHGTRVVWVPRERASRYDLTRGAAPAIVLRHERPNRVTIVVLLADGSPVKVWTEAHRLAPRDYAHAVDDATGDTVRSSFPTKRLSHRIFDATRERHLPSVLRFLGVAERLEAPALGAGLRGFESLHPDSVSQPTPETEE